MKGGHESVVFDRNAETVEALANEGANVLEEGMALRPGDIDVIYVNGFGFPRHRGGPMMYADSVGSATMLSKVKEYQARFGAHWKAAPMLERLASAGRGFYDPSEAVSPRAAGH